jgi:hypothetical protein
MWISRNYNMKIIIQNEIHNGLSFHVFHNINPLKDCNFSYEEFCDEIQLSNKSPLL